MGRQKKKHSFFLRLIAFFKGWEALLRFFFSFEEALLLKLEASLRFFFSFEEALLLKTGKKKAKKLKINISEI
jgi:hypothetical protein